MLINLLKTMGAKNVSYTLKDRLILVDKPSATENS